MGDWGIGISVPTLGDGVDFLKKGTAAATGAVTGAIDTARGIVDTQLGGASVDLADTAPDLDALAEVVREQGERIRQNRQKLQERNIPLDISAIRVGVPTAKKSFAPNAAAAPPGAPPGAKPTAKPSASPGADPERTELSGKILSVSHDGAHVCVTNEKHEVYCTAGGVSASDWVRVPGALREVDVSGNLVVGITGKGQIYSSPFGRGDWRPASGPGGGAVVSISAVGRWATAVRTDGSIWCTPDVTKAAPAWSRRPGTMRNVAMGRRVACGVAGAGDVYCSARARGPGIVSGTWLKKPGKLARLSIDDARACGIAHDGGLWCAANITVPQWFSPAVAGGRKYACASVSRGVIVAADVAGKIYRFAFPKPPASATATKWYDTWRHTASGNEIRTISMSKKESGNGLTAGGIAHCKRRCEATPACLSVRVRNPKRGATKCVLYRETVSPQAATDRDFVSNRG